MAFILPAADAPLGIHVAGSLPIQPPGAEVLVISSSPPCRLGAPSSRMIWGGRFGSLRGYHHCQPMGRPPRGCTIRCQFTLSARMIVLAGLGIFESLTAPTAFFRLGAPPAGVGLLPIPA